MTHKFSFHTAYWNPHYGVCCAYPGATEERNGEIRFSPLGDDHRGTYDMRLIKRDQADRFLVPIPGAHYDVKKSAFTFDEHAAAFIARKELAKCFKNAIGYKAPDVSRHDPFWIWEQGRREKELRAQGRYQEAAASCLSAAAIIKSQIPKP